MNYETAKISNECPRDAIAAYLDGELVPSAEFEMEMHFADCETCRAEFNEQKKLIHALDLALEKEFQLPADFTKTVVANAESNVSGLRRASERSNAFLICSILFFLVIVGIGFGSEPETVFGAFGKFAEQFLAVGGFIAHLAFDIAFGIAVILRSICLQVVSKSVFAPIFLLVIGCLCIAAFSRLMFRYNRIYGRIENLEK